METPTDNHRSFVLYGRVSTVEQKLNQTIDAQTQAAAEYAAREGRTLAHCYLDDGVNGDLDWENRPAAKQLLADARAGKVGVVCVYLFDRFSRRVLEGLLAARELKAAGVTLFSLLENYDITTPHGEFMFINSLNMAQMNKAMLKQRTADGQRRKARAGGWLGGDRAAYGYKVEGKRNTARLALDLSPVPEFPLSSTQRCTGTDATRVTVAAWIFEQVAIKGRSCVSVADELNVLNVPAYFGGPWSGAGLSRMIRNPVYKGLHQYGDEVGVKSVVQNLTAAVPAIVPAALWERAQTQVSANLRWAAKNRKRDYLLRGLIFCGDCGAAYTGATLYKQDAVADATENRKGVLYRCNARVAKKSYPSHLPCPGGGSISGEIEHIVWEKIEWWLKHPEQVQAALIEAVPARQEQELAHADELAHLTRALQGKQDERDKMLTLFRKGRIDEAALDAQLDEIQRESKALQTRLADVQKIAQTFTERTDAAHHAAAAVAQLAASLQSTGTMTWPQKRAIVVQLVERVSVHSSHVPPIAGNHGAMAKRNAAVTVRFRFTPDAPPCDSLTHDEGQINYIETLI